MVRSLIAIEAHAELASTQSLARERVASGIRGPLAISAQRQTAGRGTHGRQWYTDPGGAIACTLIWPFARELQRMSGLSLAVGLTLAQALHPAVRVKWPNDLWLASGKLGGILIDLLDQHERIALIGFGINLRTPPIEAAIGLDAVGVSESADACLPRLLNALAHALPAFDAEGFAPFEPRWPTVDALSGYRVSVDDQPAGMARGVDRLGRLLIEGDSGAISPLATGRVRPMARS
jgi:BirA family biotin operon repressor/biotin-[acetyl-CoA-carboxylase] ligase